ncbi:MAG: hypothetical protein ACLRXA_10390 [Clostridium sp.]
MAPTWIMMPRNRLIARESTTLRVAKASTTATTAGMRDSQP